jgi:hypothetical protein
MAKIITESIETVMKRWAPIVEAGPEKIESFQVKKAVSQLLENTAKEFAKHGVLTEAMGVENALGTSPVQGKNSTGYLKGKFGREKGGDGDFYLPNVIMPMVRRLFPSLIAHELVGVQALNGPLGYALAYRAKYGTQGQINGQLTGSIGKKEMAFDPVDTRYTGMHDAEFPTTPTAAQLSGALSADLSAKAWEAYMGANEAHNGAWKGAGVATGDAEFASFSGAGGKWIPQVSFDFLKTMVEAKTRKLGAGWSPELAEDMDAIHNFDVESEFVNLITYELGAEIDRQLVTEMVKTAILGGSITSWNPAMADGLDQMGRLRTLLTQVTIEANQIAVRTRRGHANFVITSPRVCALLEQLSMNKFVSFQNTKNAPSVPDAGVGALAKIGLINDGQQLLVRDTYAVGDYIVMGYKGAHPADNGIIYCPYVPVQLQKVLDPDTLTPRIGARTRYGIMNSVWDAANYYSYITIEGLTQGYSWSNTERQFIQNYSGITNGTLFA